MSAARRLHPDDPRSDEPASTGRVTPLSLRTTAMQLVWVCGDCGAHYPRTDECPERCTHCGAPRQHFYLPVED